jgi:hypothetical protein
MRCSWIITCIGLLIGCLIALIPLSANAGRRPYVMGYDDPLVPDGDVEIETWLDFISQNQAPSVWRWWIGPRWSPYETVEVLFLTNFEEDLVAGSKAELWAEQIDLRWRIFSHKRAGRITLQLNARIALVSDLAHQLSPQIGWSDRVGRFSFAAQFGYAAGFAGPTTTSDYQWLVWSAGAAFDVVKGEIAPLFQLGVEAFGQGVLVGHNDFNSTPGSTVNVGPTLALAKGRLWLSLGALFGVTAASPFAFTRGIIGVAL